MHFVGPFSQSSYSDKEQLAKLQFYQLLLSNYKEEAGSARDIRELCSEIPNSKYPEEGGERKQYRKWFWARVLLPCRERFAGRGIRKLFCVQTEMSMAAAETSLQIYLF